MLREIIDCGGQDVFPENPVKKQEFWRKNQTDLLELFGAHAGQML